MRKIIVPLTFLLITSTAFGQFKKGSTLLGGDISFNTQKIKNLNSPAEKSHGFTFSTVVAKATRDNLFWGGSLSFGSSKSVYNTNSEAKGQTYYAGVFVRRYWPIHGRFNAFFQGGLNAGRLISKTRQGADYRMDSKATTVFASATPGISVAVSKKFFLEAGFTNIASIGYTHEKQTGNNFGSVINRKFNSFGFSSSLSTQTGGLFFGSRFILPR